MDPILELPDAIVHHILCLLPLKEAAKTCALSKTWYRLWLSFAVFNFVQSDYGWRGLSIEESTERFIKLIDDCLLKFHKEEFSMMRFKLGLSCRATSKSSLAPLFDKWITMALEKNVQELDLYLPRYSFPETILVMKHPLGFYSLRKLKLHSILLTEKAIEDIARNCPSLSRFVMSFCHGFKSINLSKPQELRFLKVWGYVITELERVVVDAPNLEYLCLFSLKPPDSPMNLTGCRNLRSLKLTFYHILDGYFINSILSCLPSLEILRLRLFLAFGLVKVSSAHLKVLILEVLSKYNGYIEDVEIEGPNLETFKYKGYDMISLSSNNVRCQWDVELCLLFPRQIVWFLDLARSLRRSSSQRKVLSLHFEDTRVEFDPQALAEAQLDHVELEELELDTYSLPLIDGLLWFFRPKFLFITKFLKYEAIWSIVNDLWSTKDSNCCTSRIIKCWRHELKNVKMVRVENSEGMMMTEGNIDQKLRIQFKLEWE